MTSAKSWWMGAVGAAFALALVAVGAGDETTPKHKYLGVQACARMCHKSASKGSQLSLWEESKHAQAYKTLLTDEAKETAKKLGIAEPPHQSPKCLKCHATGYGVPQEFLADGFSVEHGVQCETCHGPGEDYKSQAVMKKRDKAIAKGLVVGDVNTCLQCHNESAPSWKPDRYTTRDGRKVGFDYEQLWAKIAHPRPAKDAE